ncbi:ankyrin repeat domain-containing protein [Niallia taxi]|nr:ankyrin repeat domain-containing protein [Niallia taxi]MDE5052356.1 ankyrin repeat domain-containing protein [Niallia taxi]
MEAVSVLLEGGADPNSQDEEGYTPIMSAIDEGSNPELLKLLLFNGADVTLQDAYGYTAFDCAESYGDEETINLLESYLYQ